MENRDLTNANTDLRRLNELDDFGVAEGYPDIRGWGVKTPTGQKLGTVKDLIVSVAELRVRYLDVEVDRDMRGPADDANGHALLPIGTVELDEKHDDVLMSVAQNDFASYPRYAGADITHGYEGEIRGRFNTGDDATTGAAGTGAHGVTPGTKAFYEHDQFEDQKAYARRRPTRGLDDDQGRDAESRNRQAGDSELRVPLTREDTMVLKPNMGREELIRRRDATGQRTTDGL